MAVQSQAPAKKRIGELLIAARLITNEQLQAGLRAQKEKGGKIVANLITMGYLEKAQFLEFLSKMPGVAGINLKNYSVPKEIIDLIPAEFAVKHEILPIDKMGRELSVVMVCPLDADGIAELEKLTGMKVRPLLVAIWDIEDALKSYYPQVTRLKAYTRTASMPEETPQSPDAVAAAPQQVEANPMAGVDKALTFEIINKLISELKTLPTLPETVAEVQRKMGDPDTSTAEIAAIIAKDPALSAKVIGLSNSSSYGFSHRVESVEMATSLLGLREIYAVVLASSIVDYFSKSKAFDYKAYWKRSMFCATAAKVIAKACGYKDAGWVFTAGLLHDIGRTVLAEVMPDKYVGMAQGVSDGELIELENEHFGIAHPEVGFTLASQWDLPPEIAHPMRYHHKPSLATEFKDLVYIIALAADLADDEANIEPDNAMAFAEKNADKLQVLNLDADRLSGMMGIISAMIKADTE
jgi:putative nucleotidyltransferase with HDIG domain